MTNNKISPDSRLDRLPQNALLGIDLIDLDHLKVFELMETIQKGNVDEDNYLQIAETLEDYVISHFGREEELMRLFCYPQYDEHLEHHKNFSAMLEEIWSPKKSSNPKSRQDLAQFLKKWWSNHILVEDRKYSEWLREELNSHSPKK